jgi:antitoxin ParD1/3/4
MVESLTTSGELSDEEFERLADELADYFEKSMPPDAKPLSDYAMSREGIYKDHL